MLTLLIDKGRSVQVGRHLLELRDITPDGYAVVSWTNPDGDRALRALEHPSERPGAPTDWLLLEDGVRVALSRRNRPIPSRAHITFDAPRSVQIYRVKD